MTESVPSPDFVQAEEIRAFEGVTVPDLIGPQCELLFVEVNPGLWASPSRLECVGIRGHVVTWIDPSGSIGRTARACSPTWRSNRAAEVIRGLGWHPQFVFESGDHARPGWGVASPAVPRPVCTGESLMGEKGRKEPETLTWGAMIPPPPPPPPPFTAKQTKSDPKEPEQPHDPDKHGVTIPPPPLRPKPEPKKSK